MESALKTSWSGSEKPWNKLYLIGQDPHWRNAFHRDRWFWPCSEFCQNSNPFLRLSPSVKLLLYSPSRFLAYVSLSCGMCDNGNFKFIVKYNVLFLMVFIVIFPSLNHFSLLDKFFTMTWRPHSRQKTQIPTFVWQEEWLILGSGFSFFSPPPCQKLEVLFCQSKMLCLVWIFKPVCKFWIYNFVKIYRKSFKNSPFLPPLWLVGTELIPIISQCFPTGYFCINLENMCQEILLCPKKL